MCVSARFYDGIWGQVNGITGDCRFRIEFAAAGVYNAPTHCLPTFLPGATVSVRSREICRRPAYHNQVSQGVTGV